MQNGLERIEAPDIGKPSLSCHSKLQIDKIFAAVILLMNDDFFMHKVAWGILKIGGSAKKCAVLSILLYDHNFLLKGDRGHF